MANTNYEKGRNKEYRIVKKMREKGYIAFRSAGSHSKFDVIAISPETKQIKLIQSKLRGSENISKPERVRINDEGLKFNGYYHVEFELWE